MKLKFIFFIMLFFLSHYINGQIRVRGKVIDSLSNMVLPNVTVAIKDNLGRSVRTDNDGNFILEMEQPSDIHVNLVGYRSRTLTITRSEEMTVRLVKTVYEINEIEISTGYQHTQRRYSTGAFEVVDNELFNRQVSTNTIDRLDGIVPALSFDRRGYSDQPEISIRGRSTLHANSMPLVVLNDFPYDGDINDINPNDIESITLLKDASAAAIWGARAGNGVIVIITKKPTLSAPVRINFNTNLSIEDKPNLHYPSPISTSSYIDVEQFLFDKEFYDGYLSAEIQQAMTPVVELLVEKRLNPSRSAEIDREIEKLGTNDIRKDFREHIYKNAARQQYAMDISGGGEKVSGLLSIGYDRNIGSLKEGYQRLTLRNQAIYQMTSRLRLDLSTLFSSTRTRQGRDGITGTTFSSGKTIYPYANLLDTNGEPMEIVKDYRDVFKEVAYEEGLLDWSYYPYAEKDMNRARSTSRNLLLNSGMSYTLLDGLNISLKHQFEYRNGDNIHLREVGSYWVRDLVNRYSSVNGDAVVRNIPIGDVLDRGTSMLRSNVLRLQADLNKSWDELRVSLLGGIEYKDMTTSSHTSRVYGFDNNKLTTVPVDNSTVYTLYTGSAGRIPDGSNLSEITNRLRSLYLNGNIAYKDRYLLSFSARQDGSNLFGVQANNRFVPLWSLGLSWELTQEEFMSNLSLPYLRFRGTYGYNGNMNNSLAALTVIRYSNSNLVNIPYAQVVSPPNPYLTWEKNGMLNIGIDFGTTGQRVSGSIEYFRKYGKDLLGAKLLDQTSGVLNPLQSFEQIVNSAEMRGEGVDMNVRVNNISKQFKWLTNYQFSYAKSELTQYMSPITDNRLYLNGGSSINPIVGKPLYAVFSYPWAGLDPENGNPMGYLDNQVSSDYHAILNTVSPENLVYHGSALPVVFGAIMNTFQYKNFSLSANLTYKLGYYFVRRSINYNTLYNNNALHGDFEKRWQHTGDEALTNVPSMVYPANPERDLFYSQSEVLVERGDHLRWNDLNISYTFSNKATKGQMWRTITPYIYVNNMGILWTSNKEGLDPDYQVGFPPNRSFSIGVRIN